MINKSKYSKEFKKICDRTIATTKEEIRDAQMYMKLWSNYSTIRDTLNESTKKLNSVNLTLQKRSETVEALKQLDQEKQEELEQVRKDIEELRKKIASVLNDESQEKSKQSQTKLLHMMLLKRCTRTYIDDKSFPHVIRGFSTNEQQTKLTPFEIDAANMPEDAVRNALWEICYRSSSFANEWDHLFFGDRE